MTDQTSTEPTDERLTVRGDLTLVARTFAEVWAMAVDAFDEMPIPEKLARDLASYDAESRVWSMVIPAPAKMLADV